MELKESLSIILSVVAIVGGTITIGIHLWNKAKKETLQDAQISELQKEIGYLKGQHEKKQKLIEDIYKITNENNILLAKLSTKLEMLERREHNK